MKSIHTETEIKAPVEKVWSVLSDFASYPEWNPFILSIEGNIKVGEKFKVTMQLPGGKPMIFKPTCLTADENKELKWLGHVFIAGIFDGEHIFKMRALEGGKTKFVQSENFKGILVSMMWKKLKVDALQGFEMMNKALKLRAESL